jgi:uncharacterized protein (DUF362 family)
MEGLRQNLMSKSYCVRAVHCDYQSNDEQVYEALRRATDPLQSTWERLQRAKRIGIKFNQHWAHSAVVMVAGQRQQLVSDAVARAVLRLLRDRTSADLFAVDTGVEPPGPGETPESCHNLLPVLREYAVPLVDGHTDPVRWVDVPGGGQMFQRYPVPLSTWEADEMVSVQKLKNHLFAGVTLCLKNLFGLVPLPPLGRPRAYYHHILRLPYMLADLGRIFNPVLNIIDGLVGQAQQEWGHGEHPRICNTLIAGDQVIATDACATYLMGHDPQADWLTEPFHRDRNALLVAAQGGFGSVELNDIDFQSEVQSPLGQFFAGKLDPEDRVRSWHRTTAEQGLFYCDHRSEFYARHAGEYILLQMGEVKWADRSGKFSTSRRLLSGAHPELGMWLKYVDPEEMEGEHYEVYEQALKKQV